MSQGATQSNVRVRPRAIHVALAAGRETLKAVADRSSLSRTTVSQIANGRECPRTTAESIAHAIGKPFDEIFETVDAPTPEAGN